MTSVSISAWVSIDGSTWVVNKVRRDTSRSVAYGDGMFVKQADSGNWWSTPDGETWTQMTDCANQPAECHKTDVVFCGDKFTDARKCAGPEGHGNRPAFGEGVWVTTVNGFVERSEDGGKTWQRVPGIGGKGNLYMWAIAFGYAQ